MNEFEELFFDTLIVFYVTLHYVSQRKFLEAVTLSKHTLSQIENCVDFSQRSAQSLGSHAEMVEYRAKYLEKDIATKSKMVLVKTHARFLSAQAEQEVADRK